MKVEAQCTRSRNERSGAAGRAAAIFFRYLDIYICWGVSDGAALCPAYLDAICVWCRWRGQTFASVNEDIDSVGGGGSVLDTAMMDQSPPGGRQQRCNQSLWTTTLFINTFSYSRRDETGIIRITNKTDFHHFYLRSFL